jgi:lia operon protein LiaG
MTNRVASVVGLGGLLALAAFGARAAAAQTPERYPISGDSVAVYNLAGQLKVEGGPGSAVVVEITRHGADAAQLKIATGEIRGRQTLRVMYPDDDIAYPAMGRGSNSTVRVRDDGTFNDGGGGGRLFGRGREVRISGRESGGVEAYADIRVVVPAGRRVAVYLAVGKATVADVDGDVQVHVSSADVDASRTKGRLKLDTGSGNVTVTDVSGEIGLDTGSGDVTVNGVTGTRMKLDTGSGNVTCERVVVDELKVDTGSGDVELTAVKARAVSLDTGSGEVKLDLQSSVDVLDVDTGSGGVTITVPADFGAQVDIETGSGGIDFTGLTIQARKLEQDHIVGQIGDGRGRVKIETGSGGVRLRRGAAE